ncbi:MAG: Signal transduction histidine kinase [Ignavibacteriae bacterium]|nr:MAG: Signal transduction histidine kinase [Ignavibacteriota bacterium]
MKEEKSTTVLVVDDDVHILRLVSVMLSKTKFVTHCVSSADAALKWLSNNEPHVILMDINLPGKDGFGILEDIKKNFDYGNTKVVAFTSIILKDDKDRFIKAGFDEYFPKPFEKKELLSFLEKIVGEISN